MEKWTQWIYDYLGMSHSFQYKVVATVVVWLLLYILRRLLTHFLLRNVEDVKTSYNWHKTLKYTSNFIFVIIISPIWFVELQSMGTFLGLMTAGLAIALKEPISNFFAWIYIVFKKPFEMGDRVQIGNWEGDILNISFFEFTLLEIKNWVKADQSTGRIIHVPNGLLFTQPVMNYNQAMNYIWNEIPVMVTFESNWQKAKQILLDVEESKLKSLINEAEENLDKAKRKYYVHYNNLTPTVYTTIKENGVMLTLRYLCHPKMRRSSEQLAIEEILLQFVKCPDIHFAYPTTRFYDATKEKKVDG
ncbi:MAG: mechanosensitive ion channel family protein [Saprospiraceae bacterium]|jgi:small-conductance mechanosensitive channel